MPKYQIRFCDSKGCGSFQYLDVKSKKGIEKKAAEKATEYIIQQASKYGFRCSIFYTPPKPMRTIHVWEWDKEKCKPKTKGHRFKLRLAFFEATYTDGTKTRKEWYEPVTVP